jgi:Holliday junction resolvasome RuvABC endonuclease subunit
MKNIIAIDISLSSSGVAIFSQDGKIKKLLTVETDSKSDTQIRLKKIADEMNEIKKEYKPSVVILEQGFSRFNISTQ